MKARFCHSCSRHIEAKGKFQDICPTCGAAIKGKPELLPDSFGAMPEYIDGPRTKDDEILDRRLYD